MHLFFQCWMGLCFYRFVFGYCAIGSYYYNDPIIEKDFVITIPQEGKEYRLCLKKSPMQEFSLYDGIVDFTQKSLRLDGIVQYKRYPLKNGKLNGLLTSPVYSGEVNVLMSFP